jgi:hypothetical protein
MQLWNTYSEKFQWVWIAAFSTLESQRNGQVTAHPMLKKWVYLNESAVNLKYISNSLFVCVCVHYLINCVELSSSRKTNRRRARQKNFLILWKPRVVEVLTTTHHWALYWINLNQFKTSHTIPLYFIIILRFPLLSGVLIKRFPMGFLTKILLNIPISHACYTSRQYLYPSTYFSNNISWYMEFMKFIVM